MVLAKRVRRLTEGATGAARLDTWLIAGAGHGYRGHEVAAAAPIADWLDRL
jgi:hypothetical protein